MESSDTLTLNLLFIYFLEQRFLLKRKHSSLTRGGTQIGMSLNLLFKYKYQYQKKKKVYSVNTLICFLRAKMQKEAIGGRWSLFLSWAAKAWR